MKEKRALLISSDDGWEALWIDKKFFDQYHKLEQGYDRGLYFLKIAETYNLTLDDFQTGYANEKADEYLDMGTFPEDYDTVLTMVDLGNPRVELMGKI